jgi:hypothetical protein
VVYVGVGEDYRPYLEARLFHGHGDAGRFVAGVHDRPDPRFFVADDVAVLLEGAHG